ncbi:Beta-glucosidase cel3A [Maublancomyces gigas]|uniref:Beta-glucosidase cel3A n=1 Tax=Discina gigas TaxID=1032678 RepID=A0ABR3GFX8_9PEZI
MKTILALAAVSVLPAFVAGQQSAWGQCGGNGYTGPTTCVSGYYCNKQNDFYSQCIPGAASTPATPPSTTAPGQPAPSSGTCTGVTKFKYFGVNQASSTQNHHSSAIG